MVEVRPRSIALEKHGNDKACRPPAASRQISPLTWIAAGLD